MLMVVKVRYGSMNLLVKFSNILILLGVQHLHHYLQLVQLGKLVLVLLLVVLMVTGA